MKYHWLALTLMIAGCGVSPSQKATGSQKFDIRRVYSECARLGCEEPNTVVSRHFANIERQIGLACIVHVMPKHGEPPWEYWHDYLKSMHMLLVRSRLQIYTYVPSGNRRNTPKSKALQNLKQLESMYIRYGVDRGAITKKVTDKWSAIIPPYRQPYCDHRPLLEIVQGARLVSPVASRAAEHINVKDRASRTVLVVMESWHVK